VPAIAEQYTKIYAEEEESLKSCPSTTERSSRCRSRTTTRTRVWRT